MARVSHLLGPVVAVVLVACGDDGPAAVIDPGDDGRYRVRVDPADFGATIDNAYLPLLPGNRWEYREESPDGEVALITVEVLDERRTVMGVDTIVVHDVVTTEDGTVVEDTHDWYAQDATGNVWYFGEETTAFEDGRAATTGSWEAGVDGALPGIVMPAAPTVSDIGYRQEYLVGEAEDMGQVIDADGSVSVPAGIFTALIRTRDWTPLEPDAVEEKSYAPGVGFVHEVVTAGEGVGTEVVLVRFVPG